MLDETDFKDQFKRKPEEVSNFFKTKGNRLGDKHWDWSDTMRHAHDRAFVVSKVASTDVLKTIRSSIQKAIDNGQSYGSWEKDLIPQLQAHGWWGKQLAVNPQTGEEKLTQMGSPRRLQTIYDTNMRTAYAAGEHAKHMEVVEDMPYWTYRHNYYSKSVRPRMDHVSLDGLTFRWDDPFWATHSFPNGWGCNCGKEVMDAGDVERFHKKPLDQAVTASKPEDFHTKTVTVQDKQVPVVGYRPPGAKEFVYPQPGWDYAPGDFSWRTKQMLYDAKSDLPQGMTKTREAFQGFLQTAIKDDFKTFMRVMEETGLSQGNVLAVGTLNPNQVFAIEAKMRPSKTARVKSELSTHLLLAADDKLVHAIRDTKAPGIGMPPEMLGELPSLLESYEARWDKAGGLLFFSEPFQEVKQSNAPTWRWKIVFNVWDPNKQPQLRFSTISKVRAQALGLAEVLE